jgi:1-acyl-sn-glycerol-3-phosphate acyltransferase
MAHRSVTPRLPARKHWLPETAIYHTLVRPAFRRSFHRIAIHAPHGEGWNDLPTLYYANHVSWWDGWVAFFLFHERWRVEGYLMMEERQLERYRFWQRCGCFSVDRSDPREGMRSVLYGADLLRSKPRRSLWIFPQGEIGPNDRRPLHTFTGAAQLARRAGRVRCVPVALRFEFRGEQRPEALVRIGEPHIVDGMDAKTLHAEMDQRLLREVDALHDDLNSGAVHDYQTALTGQVSINVWWDRVRSGSPWSKGSGSRK